MEARSFRPVESLAILDRGFSPSDPSVSRALQPSFQVPNILQDRQNPEFLQQRYSLLPNGGLSGQDADEWDLSGLSGDGVIHIVT
jgi:hypothetical protein